MLDLLLIFVVAPGLGWVAARHWRRSGQPLAANFGLLLDRRGFQGYAAGIVIAAMAMLGIFGVERALGGIVVRAVEPSSAGLLREFFQLQLSALFEEVVFRMLMLSGLVVLFGGRRGLAIGLSAALFGFAHLVNDGATLVSAFGNALGGVIYGIAYLGGRSLWLPVGLHQGWNFFQGPVLGFAISGDSGHTAWVRLADLGPAWLTGGTFGPEAGAVGMGFRFVVLAALLAWLQWSGDDGDVMTPDVTETQR